MLALLPAAPKWQFFLPVERISKLFQLRIFSCISWWRIRTSCIYVQKLGRRNRKFSNWVSKWELMIQLIKRKIPEFFHPSANSLSIRCKCGEMSYCVRLLLTCLCASVLNTFSCWKSLHYASYPAVLTERASKTEYFLKLFSHPFFRGCENIDAFFVNNGFVNSQTRLRNLHLHISDGIFDHQYSGMLFLAKIVELHWRRF